MGKNPNNPARTKDLGFAKNPAKIKPLSAKNPNSTQIRKSVFFPVSAARASNNLPAQIRAASSLLSFRRQTKAHLFQLSYN